MKLFTEFYYFEIAYALIPISGLPLDSYILPQLNMQDVLQNDPSVVDNSNSETNSNQRQQNTSEVTSINNNIIYKSISSADICKCEPELCERNNCCDGCSGVADICATESGANITSDPNPTVTSLEPNVI